MAQLNNVKTQKTTKTKNYQYKIVNINMNSYEIWTIQRQKKRLWKLKKTKEIRFKHLKIIKALIYIYWSRKKNNDAKITRFFFKKNPPK